MAFFPITTSHFDKQFSKLTRKNAVFKTQAAKKIKGIAVNPEIGVPKTHKLTYLEKQAADRQIFRAFVNG
jgi:hypothetical protein